MTLGEEERGAEGGWRAQEKQAKKMDKEPEGFLKGAGVEGNIHSPARAYM